MSFRKSGNHEDEWKVDSSFCRQIVMGIQHTAVPSHDQFLKGSHNSKDENCVPMMKLCLCCFCVEMSRVKKFILKKVPEKAWGVTREGPTIRDDMAITFNSPAAF